MRTFTPKRVGVASAVVICTAILLFFVADGLASSRWSAWQRLAPYSSGTHSIFRNKATGSLLAVRLEELLSNGKPDDSEFVGDVVVYWSYEQVGESQFSKLFEDWNLVRRGQWMMQHVPDPPDMESVLSMRPLRSPPAGFPPTWRNLTGLYWAIEMGLKAVAAGCLILGCCGFGYTGRRLWIDDRRRRRADAECCPECGYDVYGLDVCPECGHRNDSRGWRR